MIVCDVGQGDAILLQFGHQQVLIDTGPGDAVLACLNQFMPFWDRRIEVLILTHFDADHLGGLPQLVQSYAIDYVFLSLTESQSSKLFLESQQLLTTLQTSGTRLKQPFLGQQVSLLQFDPAYQAKSASESVLAQLELTFLTPTALPPSKIPSLEANHLFFLEKTESMLSAATWQELADMENDNDGSIAILLQFGHLSALLLGDLESPGELALVQQGLITRVNIQKVGHHGSKTSSHQSLLVITRPEMSLISVGQNNKFDHPHPEVLTNLQAVGSQIERTDQSGHLHLVSDGQYFWQLGKNNPASSQ